MNEIRQEGNVLHVAFPGRLDHSVTLTGSTELVHHDDFAALFRFTVSCGDEVLVCRHVLIEADG